MRLPSGLVLAAVCAGAAAVPSRPAPAVPVPVHHELCRLYGIPRDMNTVVAAPDQFLARRRAGLPDRRTSTINLNIDFASGVPGEAANALGYAAALWESVLVSDVPITMSLKFRDYSGANVLASARPVWAHASFPGAPWAGMAYPGATANKLFGADRSLSPEIEIAFNSAMNWSYVTNGTAFSNKFDFVSVALHEMGHGLGFVGAATVNGDVGMLPEPWIYDLFVQNGAGQLILPTFPSGTTALKAQLTGNRLYWFGAGGRQGAGRRAGHPRLYAPSTFNPGSSYTHLNENTYPPGDFDSLMTPGAGTAEVNHNPGPIALGMLQDMGWDGRVCGPAVSPVTASVAREGDWVPVSVTTSLPGCAWSAGHTLDSWLTTNTTSGTGTATFYVSVGQNRGAARSGQIAIAGTMVTINQAAGLSAPVVSQQPFSRSVKQGDPVTFVTTATGGNPTPAVQWQVSTNGGTIWSSFGSSSTPLLNTATGAWAATLTFTTSSTDHSRQYRAVFSNSQGSATTSAATLTLLGVTAPSITLHPVTTVAVAGTTVTFTVAATGSPAPTVRWQSTTGASGLDWSDISGATSTSLTHAVTTFSFGRRFRAVFTNSGGSAATNIANLEVRWAPVTPFHPASLTVNEGAAATFFANANGQPAPTVEWQMSDDGGMSFAAVTGAPACVGSTGNCISSLTVYPGVLHTGRRFRAAFTNVVGTTVTNAAVLTVVRTSFPPEVTTHPGSQTVNVGETATFTAAATGTPAPSVQWRVSSDGGISVADIEGATSATYSLKTTAADSGKLISAAFTNSSGFAVTSVATLTAVSNDVTVAPAALRFAAAKNGAAGPLTHVTAAQTLSVDFGSGAPAWTATADQSWIQLSRTSGTGAGSFTVSIANPDNVLSGSAALGGIVTVTAPGTTNTSRAVAVTLTVDQSNGAALAAPFGQVDTPLANATGIVGAIGVTGWAMDDVAVASVKIYRNCLPFENQASCQTIGGQAVVFVGDAAFLSGARPDVETAFPSHPQAYRAGWGYLMLTPMLPHVTAQQAYGGQGALTLYAFATDVEGNVTLLGRSQTDHTPTSIAMANDTIAKPFGAIDTPGQGQTVSGIVHNFGWALTPDSDTVAGNGDILIPANGSTMFVFVDGAPVAPVAYNQCRGTAGNPPPPGTFCNDDVANIFGTATPQPALTARSGNPTRHRNLDAGRAAIGAYSIDTTKLANGLHTIAWSVTDSAGRTEGIGSRFFTVLNSSSDAAAAQAIEHRAPRILGRAEVLRGQERPGVLLARSGFDLAAAFQEIRPADAGLYPVDLTELDRLELQVPFADRAYLAVGGQLRELPAGASLADGRFTWIPPAGYVGAYELLFVGGGRNVAVRVTIGPR